MLSVARRRVGLVAPALVLLALGYVVPMGTVGWTSLHRAGQPSLAAYGEVLSSVIFLRILIRTLAVAGATTAICLLAGYPLAYWATTRARRWGGLVIAAVTLPYLTSVLIRSYAWVAILGGNGLLNRALLALGLVETPLPLVFNSTGNLIGTVHILLPLAVLPIYAAMQRIAPELLLAGRSLGGSPASVFFTLFLPLSMPGVTAGAALVALSTVGFYITPALLGAPGDYLIAQAIEVRVSTLAEFDVAAALAWLLLGVVLGALVLLRRHVVPLPEDVTPAGIRRLHLPPLPPVFAGLKMVLERLAPVLLWTLSLGLLLFLLAPIVVVVLLAFSNAPYLSFPPPGYSLRWLKAFLTDGRWLAALRFSLSVAGAGALTALLAGTPYALALTRGRFAGRRVLWLLAALPMILPHIVLGLGLFFTAVALGLNGHPVSFWLAYTVIGLPYVVIILVAALNRFDHGLERAATSLGARPVVAFATITLPLLSAAFASAFLFAFLAGFDDLIIGLFLSSPRGTTLAIRIWEDIRLEISPKTAVVGMLQVTLLAVGILGIVVTRALRRRAAPPTAVRSVIP